MSQEADLTDDQSEEAEAESALWQQSHRRPGSCQRSLGLAGFLLTEEYAPI